MTTPLITDLCEALNQRSDRIPLTSAEILNMFRSSRDTGSEQEKTTSAYQRFNVARALYQNVMNRRHPPPLAFFYRLEEKEALFNKYEAVRITLGDNLKRYVHDALKGAPNSIQAVRQAFTTLKSHTNNVIEKKIIDDLLLLDDTILNQLQTADGGAIDTWFEQRKAYVQNTAERVFFRAANPTDLQTDYNVGTIYAPGQIHNWGTNVAWVLAITRRKIPIQLLSPLNMRGAFRTHPNTTVSPPYPSAFALEISIAVNMGYDLKFDRHGVTLIPPVQLRSHNTTGVPGDGVLPTKQQQINIYHHYVLRQMSENLNVLRKIDRGNALRNHVLTICTGIDNNAKIALMHTLWSMKERNTIRPILETLRLQERRALMNTLKTDLFNHTGYNDLRNEVMAALSVAICIGMDNKEKVDLMNTLQSMQARNTIRPILGILGLQERRILMDTLRTNLFNDARYNNLKNEVMASISQPNKRKEPTKDSKILYDRDEKEGKESSDTLANRLQNVARTSAASSQSFSGSSSFSTAMTPIYSDTSASNPTAKFNNIDLKHKSESQAKKKPKKRF